MFDPEIKTFLDPVLRPKLTAKADLLWSLRSFEAIIKRENTQIRQNNGTGTNVFEFYSIMKFESDANYPINFDEVLMA